MTNSSQILICSLSTFQILILENSNPKIIHTQRTKTIYIYLSKTSTTLIMNGIKIHKSSSGIYQPHLKRGGTTKKMEKKGEGGGGGNVNWRDAIYIYKCSNMKF